MFMQLHYATGCYPSSVYSFSGPGLVLHCSWVHTFFWGTCLIISLKPLVYNVSFICSAIMWWNTLQLSNQANHIPFWYPISFSLQVAYCVFVCVSRLCFNNFPFSFSSSFFFIHLYLNCLVLPFPYLSEMDCFCLQSFPLRRVSLPIMFSTQHLSRALSIFIYTYCICSIPSPLMRHKYSTLLHSK